jgi:hypothetical protein
MIWGQSMNEQTEYSDLTIKMMVKCVTHIQ